MRIKLAEEVQAAAMEMDGAADVQMRMLIGPDEEAPTFNMRMFDVAPGGHTPLHTHDWEHEVYVLSGTGTARAPGGDHPISPGQCIYVPPNEEHQFLNPGQTLLRFLCVVPKG